MSDVRCPTCASKHLRPSLQLTPFERLLELFGIVHLRCRDCDERFTSGVGSVRNAVYAKCPRCYRMDLTTFRRERYKLSRLAKLALSLGAKPYRCAACRCNFVSFRRLKERANDSAVTAVPVG